MTEFALKIKTKADQRILKCLKPEDTIKDLKTQLSKISNIPVNKLHVLSGFPPKPFDTSQDSLTLSSSGLMSGDTLILEEKVQSMIDQVKLNDKHNIRPHVVSKHVDGPGILMKKIVPADNSCLFSSIYFVLNGKLDDGGTIVPCMRQIIAEIVSKSPEMFSEAILGKPNLDYCVWIQDDKSWGGAIELAVLSNYYGIEIAVVDTINAIINIFGEDQHYSHRVFLVFDGIHYDPLYLEPFDETEIQTIFSSDDERVLHEAQQLAQEANSSRQYTDVNKFTLKCLNCNIFLSGQLQAREHAQNTGHMNFGEV